MTKRLVSMHQLDGRLLYALIPEWVSPDVQDFLSGQLAPFDAPMIVGLRQGGSDSALALILATSKAHWLFTT